MTTLWQDIRYGLRVLARNPGFALLVTAVLTILCQGGLLILSGVGLGLAGGCAMSRVVASLLYKASPTDPAMLIIVLTTLLATALGACWIPARRAAKIDPMKALRCE